MTLVKSLYKTTFIVATDVAHLRGVSQTELYYYVYINCLPVVTLF